MYFLIRVIEKNNNALCYLNSFMPLTQLTKQDYESMAGPDWPSLQEIAQGKRSNNPVIQQEVDNFLAEVKKDTRYTGSTDIVDAHALPSQHLELIDRYLSNFTVSSETRKWALDIEKKLLAGEPYEFDQKLPPIRL